MYSAVKKAKLKNGYMNYQRQYNWFETEDHRMLFI